VDRDQVHVGRIVAVEGPDVFPVAVEGVTEDRRPSGQQAREHVRRPVHLLVGRQLGENLRLHDVDAGVDRVGEHLPPRRLLEEPVDPALVVADDDAVLERVRHRLQPDGHQRTAGPVELEHAAEVGVGERVTGEHQERVVPQRGLSVLHASRGPQRSLLGGVLQAHPEFLAVAEVVPDEGGEELDGHHRLVEAVPLEQPQHVLHDRAVGHGEQRLRLVRGHRPQAGPLAPCHDDGLQWLRGSFPVSAIMCTPSRAESRTRLVT